MGYYTNQRETEYWMGYLSDWACDWLFHRAGFHWMCRLLAKVYGRSIGDLCSKPTCIWVEYPLVN